MAFFLLSRLFLKEEDLECEKINEVKKTQILQPPCPLKSHFSNQKTKMPETATVYAKLALGENREGFETSPAKVKEELQQKYPFLSFEEQKDKVYDFVIRPDKAKKPSKTASQTEGKQVKLSEFEKEMSATSTLKTAPAGYKFATVTVLTKDGADTKASKKALASVVAEAEEEAEAEAEAESAADSATAEDPVTVYLAYGAEGERFEKRTGTLKQEYEEKYGSAIQFVSSAEEKADLVVFPDAASGPSKSALLKSEEHIKLSELDGLFEEVGSGTRVTKLAAKAGGAKKKYKRKPKAKAKSKSKSKGKGKGKNC